MGLLYLLGEVLGITLSTYGSSFRPHYDPGIDSASNRNEYQRHFLGDKAVGWETHPMRVPIV